MQPTMRLARKVSAAACKVREGLYIINMEGGASALGFKGTSGKAGSLVLMCEPTGNTSQLWWILKSPGVKGAYIIESAHGGSVIAASSGTRDGSSVLLARYTGKKKQLWVPMRTADGKLTFTNAASGFALFVRDNSVVQKNLADGSFTAFTMSRRSPRATATDIGLALKGLRDEGVVVEGVKWARNVKMPKSKVTATTAQGKSITGANIGALLVQTIKVSKAFMRGFGSNPQAAFDELTSAIKEHGSASGNILYRILLPKGTYQVRNTMHVYGNTWVDMRKGTVLKRAHDKGCMLRVGKPSMKVGGYRLAQNLIVQGGTFDANVRGGHKSASSTFRLGHCRNVLIWGVKFKQVRTHMLEFSGVADATVQKCRFVDDGSMKAGDEAIQIECVSTRKAASGFERFDFTPCQNIVIAKNVFRGVNRGLGNHCSIRGRYDERILVKANTFSRTVNEAIDMPSTRHFIVARNKIKRCGAGISIQSMHPALFVPQKGVKTKVRSKAYGEVRGNRITTAKRGDLIAHFGISLMGLATGNAIYRLAAMTVIGNVVKACDGADIVKRYLSAS
ncbi:MAG: RICIN domain-containing protein, partial [Coriobacteriia bacterium]|nr:RICIN domain-containing protein [Coriobacteriia bacterium]